MSPKENTDIKLQALIWNHSRKHCEKRSEEALSISFLTHGLIINELCLGENTALNATAGTKQE